MIEEWRRDEELVEGAGAPSSANARALPGKSGYYKYID